MCDISHCARSQRFHLLGGSELLTAMVAGSKTSSASTRLRSAIPETPFSKHPDCTMPESLPCQAHRAVDSKGGGQRVQQRLHHAPRLSQVDQQVVRQRHKRLRQLRHHLRADQGFQGSAGGWEHLQMACSPDGYG